MKKIIFTGGGTLGHVTPNLSIIDKIKDQFEIHYIGSKNGIEKEIINNYKFIKYHEITTCKFIRKFTFKNLLIPFKLFKGISESKKIIKEVNPNIIFSKGGFVSVPVAFAGSNLKIPIIAHESDYTMGLANKLIYKKANKMCFSFLDTCKNYNEKGIFTGTPIRKEIFYGDKSKILDKVYINKNLPNVLIFGGSLGAKAINNAVINAIHIMTLKYNVFHIVGKGNLNNMIKLKNYHQIEFTNNIEDYFDLADLVICRAGSNSIFELCALNKPMLLIPLPLDSSRGDQLLNAKYLAKRDLAITLMQENLNANTLMKNLDFLNTNKNKYINNLKHEKNINGTDKIVELIKKYSK